MHAKKELVTEAKTYGCGKWDKIEIRAANVVAAEDKFIGCWI